MEEIEIWIARDKTGELFGYTDKCPCKNINGGGWDAYGDLIVIPDNLFPSIKWEDREPIKAKIILNK